MGEPFLDLITDTLGIDQPDWLDSVGDPLGLFGGPQRTPKAAQLTPEQQAAVAAGFANPSTAAGSGLPSNYAAPSANPYGNPAAGPSPDLTGAATMPQGTAALQAGVNQAFSNYAPQNGVGGGQGYAPSGGYANSAANGYVPPPAAAPPPAPTGPSLRDVALEGYYAGPRTAPQATAGQMAQPANVQGATIGTSFMQPGQRVVTQGTGIANQGVGVAGRGLSAADQGLGFSTGTRGVQDQQTARLTSAADGLAPSVAQQQLRSGLAQGMQNNLAMAASARGSGSGAVLAQRQAQDANTALAARTNAQAGQLRAGEMAQARGELGQHLGTVRGQDLTQAGTGVQMGGLGVALTNAGTGLAGVGANLVGTGAQLGTAQAGFNQQANLANQSAALTTGQANLNADQQTAIANLNAQMTQAGMDDAQKMQHLSAVLGIDARTQEGQQQLQQLLMEAKLRTDATNAGIGMANSQAATDLRAANVGMVGNAAGALFGMG